MMMYGISLLVLVLIDRSFSTINYWECGERFKPKHLTVQNMQNHTHPIEDCPPVEVPSNINIVTDNSGASGYFPGVVKVVFPPPIIQCGYTVTLLVNPSIQNKDECETYLFDETNNLYQKTHTLARTICHLMAEDDRAIEYENNIVLRYRYVFPGCYALLFRMSEYTVVTGKQFVNTSYQQNDVTKPLVFCRTKRGSKHRQEFLIDIALPSDTGYDLNWAVYLMKQDKNSNCHLPSYKERNETFGVDLEVSPRRNTFTDENCSVKLVRRESDGEYESKLVRCHLQQDSPPGNYCYFYSLFDNRCQTGTVWKPPYSVDNANPNRFTYTCEWVSPCMESHINWPSISENTRMMKLDDLYGISQCNDDTCFKSRINFGISAISDNDSEKSRIIKRDNPSCNNIVLLYTNSSTFFMTLMKGVREQLVKICSCPVHDWHDEAVKNEVSRVGVSAWFTKLLNNGSRIVWADTPTTRSIIRSNLEQNNWKKVNKCYQIEDHTDEAWFCMLFVIARRQENRSKTINDEAQRYPRHFVAAFDDLAIKGEKLKVESTENANDPFLELSSHGRYYIPQDLDLLGADLSVKRRI